VAGTIFHFTCVVVVYQNQSLQMRQRVSSLAAEIPPFLVFFGAKIQHVSENRPYCGLGFGHKKCAKKICAPERTVDQKRADNPGLERAGVRLFFVVKSELF
jgi:hypothetical protein